MNDADALVERIAALLVIAPHPDDEVLGCGWLMRAVARAGGRVIVAWMTDGGGSHGDQADAERAALVAARQAEASAGLAELGIAAAALYHFGARDGYLAEDGAARDAAAWLQDLCRLHAIDTVAVTAGDDGHPDHRAAFQLARSLAGVGLYAYPVGARYDGAAAATAPQALRIGPFADDAKRRALLSHASQIEGGGALHPLRTEAIDRFCTEAETFSPVLA